MAGYLAQAGLFAASGAALSGYALYSDIKHARQKRKFQEVDEGIDLSFDSKRQRMAFPRRRTFRRRFRRRFRKRFKRRVPFNRRRFTKRVRRVILKTAEAKKLDNPSQSVTTFREGDGTSRTVYIRNLCAILGNQGLDQDHIVGNSVWIKGFAFCGQIGLSQFSVTSQGALLRVSLVWSKQQLTVGTGTNGPGFLELNSGTTSALTQTAGAAVLSPEQVPGLFEGTKGTTANYIGLGYVIPFDKTQCKRIKTYTIPINPSGDVGNETNTTVPTPFNLWFPINKKYQWEDPTEANLSGTSHGKYGTYYLVLQLVADTNSNATANSVECDYRLTTYYKDP